MDSFLSRFDELNTSYEVLNSISVVAGGDEVRAMRIWDDPSFPEIAAVVSRLLLYKRDLTEFIWAGGYVSDVLIWRFAPDSTIPF